MVSPTKWISGTFSKSYGQILGKSLIPPTSATMNVIAEILGSSIFESKQ